MGTLPVAESSEEIRLQLSEMVAGMIERQDRRQLAATAPDLVRQAGRKDGTRGGGAEKCGGE